MVTLKENGMIDEFCTRYHLKPSNICNLCWGLFGMTAGLTMLGVLTGFYVMGFVMFFFYPDHPSVIVSIVGTIMFIVVGFFVYADHLVNTRPGKFRTIVGEGYRGWKEKYCPLVEFK